MKPKPLSPEDECLYRHIRLNLSKISIWFTIPITHGVSFPVENPFYNIQNDKIDFEHGQTISETLASGRKIYVHKEVILSDFILP